MTSPRTLTTAPRTAMTDEITKHGYAIVQTRAERVPRHTRPINCQAADECPRNATLITLAVDEITIDDGRQFGIHLAKRDDGAPLRAAACDQHRHEASHILYHHLTGHHRTDGIPVFDFPGLHMHWPTH